MKVFLALLLAQGVILTSCDMIDWYCDNFVELPIYDHVNAAKAIKFAGK